MLKSYIINIQYISNLNLSYILWCNLFIFATIIRQLSILCTVYLLIFILIEFHITVL